MKIWAQLFVPESCEDEIIDVLELRSKAIPISISSLTNTRKCLENVEHIEIDHQRNSSSCIKCMTM
jgi:hypothetical protein